MEQAFWFKLGAFIKWIAPAALGSALSIYFNPDKSRKMSYIETAFVFLCGLGLAHYIGGALIEHYKVDHLSLYADAIKLVVALFGMAGISQSFVQIPKVFDGLRKKYTGE